MTGNAMTTEAEALAESFDLRALPRSFYDDPYPTYHALRQHAPVKRLPDGLGVFLTRYADLAAVYRDAKTFSSDKKTEFKPKFGDSPLYEHHTTSLVFNDPPLHTRVRKLIAGALTQRAIAGMEPDLQRLVDRLLDAIEAKPQFDLIEDFASAIPIEVIGNLLAVPHAERAPLRGWSLAILSALEPAPSPELLARGNQAVADFVDYLKHLVAERRARPGDLERDVLTRLITGERAKEIAEDPHGERLSEVELLQNCIFILNAGHETTTNLIGNSLVALTQFPAQRERLIAEPALIDSAIEEFLRFESSNQLGNRIAVTACEIGGEQVAAGTQIHLGIAAANRDPAVFANPDQLDITRAPNRHLAFGFGIHQCVGLSLARLEGRIAINRLLQRFPRYQLAAKPQRAPRARFRGFTAIPASIG